MDVEDAFSLVGNLGRFQLFVAAIISLTNVNAACQIVLMIIVGATPNLDIPSERNLTTIVTEWNLYNDQWIVDLTSSVFMAGFAVGVIIFGQVSDLYGRKWIFTFNFFFSMVSSLCTSFSNNWKIFTVTRAFTGFFIGAMGHVLFALLLENIGKDKWGLIGMIYQAFFSLGVMLLSFYGYMLLDWRHVCIVTSTVPMILLPIYIFIIPESSRWLYHVGKIDEAEKVLQYIAKLNGRPYSDIKLSSRSTIHTHSESSNLKKYSIIDMFKNSTLATYAVCSFYIWFACSFVYYGLTLDASELSPNIYIATMLSGFIEIPAVFLSYLAMRHRWFGRKGTMLICFVLSVTSNVGQLFSVGLGPDTFMTVQTVFGLVNKLAVSGAFAVLYVYVAEIFPTQLRLVAIGGSSMFARVGAIISPFVPLLAPVASYLPYIVFGVVAVLWGILNLFLPETLNKPTPDISDFIANKKSCNTNVFINENSPIISDDQESDRLLRV